MTTPVQKAEIDRTEIGLKITLVEKRIAKHATFPISIGAAALLLKKIDNFTASLKEVHMRIAHLTKPEDMNEHEAIYVDWNERLDNATFEVIEIKAQATPATSAAASSSSSSHTPLVKLPDMQLPAFDGKFEDWPSFEDLFKATIDSRPGLSGAVKLQYLKSCVKEEASSLIKSFTVTDANYVDAWNLLSSRYNNTREIVYSLVRKIANQPRLTTQSASSLQTLLNTTLENVRSLKVMGRPTEHWDDLLVVTMVEKLDSDTKSEWAKSLLGTNPTSFAELTEFLERHIRSLLARGSVTTKVTASTANNHHNGSRQQARIHHAAIVPCSLCKGNHQLYQCSKLLEMLPPARQAAVKETAACFNCLREGHSVRNCNSKHSCKQCSERHHSLLHVISNDNGNSGGNNPQLPQPPNLPAAGNVNANTASSHHNQDTVVLLKTAIVHVRDAFGNKREVRALLDDGSEASFITESLVNSFGLFRSPTNVLVTGISATNAAQVKSMVTVRLHSCIYEAHVDVEALILAKVTGKLPGVPCDANQWTHLDNIQLADPSYTRPGDIDILLGADVVASIMRHGRRQGQANTPTAQNSIFGWVLSGKVGVNQQRIIRSNHASCSSLEQLVQRRWMVEEVPTRKPLSLEEATCEAQFSSSATRNTIEILHVITLKADIAKMYRQFEIHPTDRDNQRILWRDDSSQPIKEFKLSSSSAASSVTLQPVDMEQVIQEEKPILAHHVYTDTPFIIKWIEKFSNLKKLISATAVMQRFIHYFKSKKVPQHNKFLSIHERKYSLLTLIKHVQRHNLKDDLKKIKTGKEVTSSSKLKTLAPFNDEEILRVDGRLQNSTVKSEWKRLPKHSHLTSFIVLNEHHHHYHAGMRITLAAIQQQYWILNDQAIIKFILKKCSIGKKAISQTIHQQMGNLPTGRVNPTRPFTHAGVDFSGPLMITFRSGRGSRGEKCYFAIFVCLATKAIHLEVVSSLSTPAFIACYRRFIARRGISSDLYSDCGTNFVGADRELKEHLLQAENQYQQQLSHHGTKWHFNPAGSPHQGGLWEAGVKSVKHHLRRVMGNNLFTLEQFQTLLCNIEACLNSRPLVSFSSDPSDCSVLTPGHFLVGSPLTAVPEASLLEINPNRLSYWQVVQQRTQHFWSRWSSKYLNSLSKWMRKQPNVSIGDLVAIRDENLPPTKWKLGRVLSVHPGPDELVRKVTLRTVIDPTSTPVKYGEITRAIQKLSPIMNSNEMQ